MPPSECTGHRSVEFCANTAGLGLAFYVMWHEFLNELGVTSGAHIYKMEDLSGEGEGGDNAAVRIINDIFMLVDATPPTTSHIKQVLGAHKSAPSNVNARKHRATFTWQDMLALDPSLAQRAWQLGKTFGYTYDFDFESAHRAMKAKYGGTLGAKAKPAPSSMPKC